MGCSDGQLCEPEFPVTPQRRYLAQSGGSKRMSEVLEEMIYVR